MSTEKTCNHTFGSQCIHPSGECVYMGTPEERVWAYLVMKREFYRDKSTKLSSRGVEKLEKAKNLAVR